MSDRRRTWQPWPIDLYGDDAWSLRITMRSRNSDGTPGAPINLTGRTYRAQIRSTAASATVLVELAVNTSEAAAGVVTVSIPDGVNQRGLTGEWDLQETLPGVARPTTLFRGPITWTQDVTR